LLFSNNIGVYPWHRKYSDVVILTIGRIPQCLMVKKDSSGKLKLMVLKHAPLGEINLKVLKHALRRN
jgi:hypothetical protein